MPNDQDKKPTASENSERRVVYKEPKKGAKKDIGGNCTKDFHALKNAAFKAQ